VPGTYVVETALRRWLRAYGSLPHPNVLAGFLAVAMVSIIWFYQKIGYGLKKLLLPVIFAVLSLGLFVTFSKSVMASFLAILIFLWITALVLRRSKDFKIDLLKFTLIFLVIAIIFSAVFWEPVSTRLVGQERLEIESTTERLSYFDQAWQLIKKHPLLGVGLGNYTLAVHNEIDPDLQSWDYQPVHNIYFLVLAELGIVGLILWLALLAVFIFKNFKIKELVTAYPLLFTLLFIGLFDHYLLSLYFGIIIFWLTVGLVRKLLLDDSLDR
jgi:O-antigen ligase